MIRRAVDNKYRNTVVCVDSYQEKVMKGRIYNPYIEGNIEFCGLMSFILAMEEMLDKMDFPQAYEIKRCFEGADTYTTHKGNALAGVRGEKETFGLKIFFRQNASWQGTILWEEDGREESFRSVLELVLLMNSALQEKNN